MGAVMQSTVNALSAVGVQCEVETAETDEFTAMFISRIGEQTNELRNGSPSAIKLRECSLQYDGVYPFPGDRGGDCTADTS